MRSGRAFRVGLAALLLAIAGGCSRMGEGTVSLPAPAEGPVERTMPANADGRSVISYSPVVKRASPAVVTVRSARVVRQPRQFPFMDHPWFGNRSNAVPQQRQAPQVQAGLGSGVIVTPDGYILTNHHVVDGAEMIRVQLVDRRSFEARVVGSDAPSDLAVLKIEANDLAVLNLGDSDTVEVGDVVLALGNPLGLEQTVTAGIISAKGRSTGLSDGSFEDFLQTDAPINQGNSGGALINTAGELVGINSQILSPTGGNIGIGFAIPSNMARNVMDQLIRTGSVRRGMLGVVVQPVTADIAQQQNMPEPRGVAIAAIQPNGPAASAGLKEGDIITALNNEPINESNHLRNRIASLAPGTEITLTIFRSGSEQQLRATLGEVTTSPTLQ